jgi:hypothetical protein
MSCALPRVLPLMRFRAGQADERVHDWRCLCPERVPNLAPQEEDSEGEYDDDSEEEREFARVREEREFLRQQEARRQERLRQQVCAPGTVLTLLTRDTPLSCPGLPLPLIFPRGAGQCPALPACRAPDLHAWHDEAGKYVFSQMACICSSWSIKDSVWRVQQREKRAQHAKLSEEAKAKVGPCHLPQLTPWPH